MHPWLMKARSTAKRHLAVSVLAVATVVSFVGYETVRPASAAATPASTVAPLDDNSIAPLLSLDHAMETLAARVTPAIVNITVTSKSKSDMLDNENENDNQNDDQGQDQIPEPFRHFFGPGMRMFPHMQQGPQIEHVGGSGVIISPDGYIVTNNHVVDGAVDIHVTMSNRKIMAAKLIGRDPLTDLAVIKIDGHDLPNAPLGDSTKLRPGQTVLAFGNPFGFQFTVTRGIISALNRPNPDLENRRKPGGFIQTDAAINQGNSGGPLVDVRGEVVGINTFLISPSGSFSGMGFAIPTQTVRPVVDQIMRTGKVKHGYMGIAIEDVTPENAKFFDVNNASGALVSQVEDGSPAAKAGLKVGDVITELDGEKVNDSSELQMQVSEKEPGTTIQLGILRNGKSMTIPVTLESLGNREKSASEVGEHGQGKMRWGLALDDLSPEIRQQLQAPADVHGAVVEQVKPGSPADDAGLQKGDIITQVNRKDVNSASDVQQALASMPKGQDALLLVWSHGGSTFRVVHAPAE
jgi:serine protease Do